MIWAYFLDFLVTSFRVMFDWVPDVTTLPFGIDEFMTESVGHFYSLASVFWPLQPIIACFIFYIGFMIVVQITKFFLGSRVPDMT